MTTTQKPETAVGEAERNAAVTGTGSTGMASTKYASEEEARDVAEKAREDKWDKPSFLREMFLGNFRPDLLYPFPESKGVSRPEFQEYYEKMRTLLVEEVDADAIDRDGQIPRELRDKLAELGAFGMKIEKEYGGLGLSQAEYNRLLQLIASHDANLVALLSAHQSIGVPQPVKMFGSEAQKKKYLPKCAAGAVSAFALTEPNVGSDPAKLATTAVESEDGQAYILNGTKLWCTDGTIADFLVVMARHPEDSALSAFIVETAWEGVKVEHRCHFMGLKAIENAVISFKDVRVPKENLLWARGKGLKLALITLNTGRLSLPAAVTGVAKACLEIVRIWSKERVQWGLPIGKHEAIAHMVAEIAATVFAMESVWELATAMSDQGYDIRLEAAVAKLFNSEVGWKVVDDTLQIRGGRGYETADSLRERGEVGVPVERMMRDFRINRIYEGSSEVMRLFIAREAVDKHLEVAGAMIDRKKGIGDKLKALPGIGAWYAKWYPARWFGKGQLPTEFAEFESLAKHMRFVERSTRKLSRQVFHAMMRYQGSLQRRQGFLFRVVDIGAELFAMSASASRALKLAKAGRPEAIEVADLYCRISKRRVKALFKGLWQNDDPAKTRFAKAVLDGKYAWLEEGIVGLNLKEGQSLVADNE